MRTPFLRVISLVCLALCAAYAVRTHDARAAWPPKPGDDMRDKANWPNDYNARWNYISFFPERTTAEPLLDADVKLGAAGMSIDRAWTHTIGRDEVKIGVIDSGIHWEHVDLINKVALNAAELRADKRPRNAAGDECGGAGDLAGYDCNGDGIFNIADYKDDARFTGTVPGEKCYSDGDRTQLGDDRAKGDLNRNCVIDPGDLILMFSDGVDDDANGYTDDIAGWDFFKNDNDPYDDTRYGHGTGEARDSAAEANNGGGDPGVCPACRFIPLRVGDSFITDANEFAKAVIYAADNNVKVIQEALGTINQTAFSKAAIDYAYAKGAIVMASMADENSRHHNMPATANHVMTVHSIRYNEQKIEQSTSFIAFDTCSNYGGHLSLSISATSCSSEATGRSSGIAGLVYSMAAQEGITLSAEEVIQIFKMYADDIDVLESRGPEARYYFSHAGFDQRFGYGRANALRMVEAVKSRMIPPEVDIVSPEWFAPIHADRSNGPIAVMGRVAAARAPAYDFRIQWAPGVQPEESQYQDLASPLVNVPGQTVTGGTTPLAQIDPNQIDTKHERDPDSQLGENDRSISIRVQAVAHYPTGDVKGEARRVISITNEKNGLDKDLLPGFPMNLGTSIEGSAKLADIDGDGVREIIAPDTAGKVHVFTMRGGTPTELPGFPYVTRKIDGLNTELASEPTVPSYVAAPAYKAGAQGGVDPALARETILAAPAIGDLDGDGKADIVFATWAGTVYAINGQGQDLPGWPKRMPLVPSCPLDTSKPKPPTCMDAQHGLARGTYAAPVLADMNKDGRPEIVITGFDGNIWVYKVDGTVLDGFPVSLASKAAVTKGPSRIMATPTVADLNGDGVPEIISGSNEQIGGGGGSGPVFAVDGRGNAAPGGAYLPNWPVTVTSVKIFPVVAEGVVASQAVADFDGDQRPDIVIQGNASRPLILQADPGVQTGFNDPPNRLPERVDETGQPDKGLEGTGTFGEKTKAFEDIMFPLFSQPSIGDMDQDGTPDVIISGGSLTLVGALAGGGRRAERAQHLLAFWSGKTGKMLPGSPVVIEDYTFLVNHAIADVSGDDYPEAITGSGGYFVHAADACGREAPGWPKFTNGWTTAAAAVGDIDGDAQKSLEVVVGTRTGYLFAWTTQGRATGPVEWESFHHDNANTGNYATKLDQGRAQRAPTPISCDDPEPAVPESYEAGGCGCKTTPSRGGVAGAIAAALALGLCLARRRRSS
ncbi:MAG: VCBS repeat-containing protein [Labilithrix sp.]|nr:VCBS repeat-containing protein [Labilithrix sp.]